MASVFQDKSILIALDNPPTAKTLAGILKILQFENVDTAQDGSHAFRVFKEKNHDIVITELVMSPMDGRYLANQIRDENSGSPNTRVPLILNAGQSVELNIEEIRNDGFTDLLLSPFSFDDVKTRLAYVLQNYNEHSVPPAPEPPIQQEAPNPASQSPEEDQELVKSLLGHYMDHHEAVLQKLRFAQDATAKSIAEIQEVREELEGHDNASIVNFSRFEKMWEEIIEMFVKGGISEDDIFKIENLITSVPGDIKKHYDQLTQQDKSFLTMIEALNHDAYRKARDVALAVQARPNLMTGLTPDDYRAKSEEEEDADMSFIFRPVKKS
jgi:CheY-like chemotaxis protein/cell fate (sporulation/competence/biofilm development) regulator YlbF (YheA/YmcA/DUF963 family)